MCSKTTRMGSFDFNRVGMELVVNEKKCSKIENMGFGGESVKIKPIDESIKIDV